MRNAKISVHETHKGKTTCRAQLTSMNWQRGLDFSKLAGPLLALWISIGLHGALIALVKIVPPPPAAIGNTIEARLMPKTMPRDVPLYLPEPAAPAVDEMLSYSPLPPSATKTPAHDLSATPQASPLPQIEVPLAVDLHYYSALELDITPNADIPVTLSGKIQYQVKIEEDGHVSDVDVMRAELAAGDDAAVLARTEALLRATRFKPGMKNGRPVRAVVVYEFSD